MSQHPSTGEENPWQLDFSALRSRTDRRLPPLTATAAELSSALEERSQPRRSLMAIVSRRPLLAAGIALVFLAAAAPVAYAVVTDRWHFFVDADDSEEAINQDVERQARRFGARADVSVAREDDDVRVRMTYDNLSDMITDCVGSSGEVRDLELTVGKGGEEKSTRLDRDKHAQVMAVLQEAARLSEELHRQGDAENCELRVLVFVEERFRALGIAVPPHSDSPEDRIRALEDGVRAWFGPDAPFEFRYSDR